MSDVRQALACRIQSDKLKFIGHLFEISSRLCEKYLFLAHISRKRRKGNPKPQKQIRNYGSIRFSCVSGKHVTESAALFMNRLMANRFRILGATKILVAAFLLIGTLATVVPLRSVSASTTCRLACCAKRAPHSAGSCADGTCHTSLKRNRRQARHRAVANDLCGLVQKSDTKTRPRLEVSAKGTPIEIASAFGKPCPPECSGTLANSNSQRNSATISGYADANPATVKRPSFTSTRAHLPEMRCGECAPRGPPVLS